MRYSYTQQINPQPGYWVTADRRKLKISKMDIHHIRNCIRLIERNNATEHENNLLTLFGGLSQVGGDGAYIAIEHEIAIAKPKDLPKVHAELIKELKRKEDVGFTVRIIHKVTKR
ncbi:hypothetical protein LCGC14_1148160 [marine sediment metagenome]|uniref:Uncharacterized protein n=1 Tax=marine sediment metagenome TaxID=412755 RepID=A0A0F9Q1Z1_9ZZZZ